MKAAEAELLAVAPELRELREALDRAEAGRLSAHACRSAEAVRRHPDDYLERGHRQQFSADADRVLHSLAYSRYVDKTQVFSLIENDHITHRVLHVQFVSKIARTVGRLLSLNEDLIEAIALAHDIGHCPFGHEGEHCLSELCRENGAGAFHHAAQGVRFLEAIERKGLGWNLSLQVLDGILTHDGEAHHWRLTPARGKTFADLDREMALRRTGPKSAGLLPLTLEGCVVRLCDTISYIGRDIEDAIRVGLIRRDDIPEGPGEVLGRTNGKIVYHLVADLVQTSLSQPWAAFSPEVAEALEELKRFNIERIYHSPRLKQELGKVRRLFRMLFERYLDDLKAGREESLIFRGFLSGMSEDYLASSPVEIVRDFIAGMTDDYFLAQCQGHLLPERIQGGFR